LGGLASIPTGYSFYFGNDPVEAVFDGQIAGALNPGQTKDFVFGIYTPIGKAAAGFYPFSTQLQIFDATVARLMLGAPTVSGNWEVAKNVPEPATLVLVVAAGIAAFATRRAKRPA